MTYFNLGHTFDFGGRRVLQLAEGKFWRVVVESGEQGWSGVVGWLVGFVGKRRGDKDVGEAGCLVVVSDLGCKKGGRGRQGLTLVDLAHFIIKREMDRVGLVIGLGKGTILIKGPVGSGY